MKKIKNFAILGAAILTVSAMAITAFAASDYKTPAEVVAGLTGKSVESVVAERTESDKTYGTIANDAGKLEEFKSQMIENKKAVLNDRVAEGQITQERADAIIEAIDNNQANCDGTGNGNGACGIGQGLGFGAGKGGQQGGQGGRLGGGAGNGQGAAGYARGTCTALGQNG